MNFEIRTECPGDAAAIEAVTVAAFLNAPYTQHTEQFIVAALRLKGKLTISLVAETKTGIIGHVAVSPVSISDGTRDWYGLGPISVAPESQGCGVGSQLMHEALHMLRASNASGCVLLGNPAYYHRFGFRADPRLVLPGFTPEHFQAISFGPFVPSGIVTYDDSFDARGPG